MVLYAGRVALSEDFHSKASASQRPASSWIWPSRAFASVVLGVASYWSLVHGIIVGIPAVVVVIAAVFLVPSARQVSGRIALNGSFALTAPPVIAALPIPMPIDPGALLTMGAVVALIMSAGGGRTRPAFAAIDCLPLASLLISVVAVKDFIWVHESRTALVRLLPGYDYSAHFDIFEMLRQHAAAGGDAGPRAAGSAWAFVGYPRGYHAACAMIADLGGQFSDRVGDLPAFAMANGVLVVCASTCLVAAVCSLKRLREAPTYAALATFMILGVMLLGVGSRPITNGFVNYWLAAAFASLALVLALDDSDRWRLRNIAVQCLIVGAAFAWIPLAALAVPALLIAMRRDRQRVSAADLWRQTPCLAICLVPAVQIVTGNGSQIGSVLYANGGFLHSTSYMVASVLIIGLSVAAAVTADSRQYGTLGRFLPRRVALSLVPLVGVAMAFALGGLQLVTSNGLTYYFFKIVGGLDMVLAVVTVAIFASLAGEARKQQSGSSRALVFAGVTALAGLGLLFGVLGQRLGPAAVVPNTTTFAEASSVPPIARDLIAAARWTGSNAQGADVEYVPIGRGAGPNKEGDRAWLMALTGSYTRSGAVLDSQVGNYSGLDSAALAVRRAQSSLPGLVVLTQPARASELRAALRSAGVSARVRSW